jgi:type IV pilus assembly protein PilC
MPLFLWEGKNRKNEVQKGEMQAPNEEAVRANLSKMRITPTKVKKKPKDLFENVSFLQPKVTQTDIILFCRQFSTMIDAGLPIIQCLDILQSQQENKTFKKMLKQIKDSVESGQTLAEALKQYPKEFDDLFVNMIAAGEAGGILDTILRRLSGYMEKAAKLKKRVKGAMVYPCVTLGIAVLVVAVILVFVIPVFQECLRTWVGRFRADHGCGYLSNFVKGNILYILGAAQSW